MKIYLKIKKEKIRLNKEQNCTFYKDGELKSYSFKLLEIERRVKDQKTTVLQRHGSEAAEEAKAKRVDELFESTLKLISKDYPLDVFTHIYVTNQIEKSIYRIEFRFEMEYDLTIEILDKKEMPEEKTNEKIFDCHGALYKFSWEVQKALLGERGEDHKVSKELIEKCIQKKNKHMKIRARKNPAKDHSFDYYFRDPNGRTLNLVVNYYQNNNKEGKPLYFNVLTCYYLADNVLKERHRSFQKENKTQLNFESWKESLPLLPKLST